MKEPEYVIPRTKNNPMLIVFENAKYCFKILNAVKKITDEYKNKKIDFNECQNQLNKLYNSNYQ